MKNMTIKIRLIALVVLLIGMMVGIGIFGMVSTHDIVAHLETDAHTKQDLAHTLELAEQAQIKFGKQIQEWKNILIRGNNPKQYDKYKSSFDKNSQQVQNNLSLLQKKLKELNLDDEAPRQIMQLHLKLKNKYDESLQKFNRNDPETGKAVDILVKGFDRPVFNTFAKMAISISAETDKVISQSEAYAEDVVRSTRNTNITIMLVGSVIGIIMAIFLIRGIVNPLNQIVYITQRLAEGDMTVKINVDGKNEISNLELALSNMSKKLCSVIKQVSNSAGVVNTSAEEIADGNLDLSSRTEEQAASLEETSASMQHVTEKVQQNSKSAVHAVELASNATEKAKQGLDVAQTAVSAINEIKSSSEKVADIIGVIDQIAFQTNLLALNASIEAERAGEQGRGFSVVANEVQKLAQRSADAANEIKGLIKNSTEKVDEGTELVLQSSNSLEDIVKTSNETNTVIQSISNASQEQAQALTQINTTVSQLEQMTQQNAAQVEETSASSIAMSEEAKTLSKLVAFFKFEHSESPVLTDSESKSPVDSNLSSADKKSVSKERDAVQSHIKKKEGNHQPGKDEEWENF